MQCQTRVINSPNTNPAVDKIIIKQFSEALNVQRKRFKCFSAPFVAKSKFINIY